MSANSSDYANSNLTLFNQSDNNTTEYDMLGAYWYGDYVFGGFDNREYDVYLYTAFSFEKPFYLYILEIISFITVLGNIVVMSVLLRRKMRNSTNIVLAAIAVTDSLTALVVLPTYIMVYTRYYSNDNDVDDDVNYQDGNYTFIETSSGHTDGCELTKELCQGFMISQYFLAKSFHSMSVFLTLFLSIERYISIRFPLHLQDILSLPRRVVCYGAIVIVSPCLHVYHLIETRASKGKCQWELSKDGCGSGCIYLFLSFLLGQLIPCLMLVSFTILFIKQLQSGVKTLRRMDTNQSQISRRVDENRRITIIVTAVVVVFLIPEIPYSAFLLYNAIDKAANDGKGMEPRKNRFITLIYQLLLVLTFHANIYIYTFVHRRFRRTLVRVYLNPVRRFLGNTDILSRTSSSIRRSSSKKTESASATAQVEMKPMMISKP